MHGTGALLQVWPGLWGTAATGTRVDTRTHTGTDGKRGREGEEKKEVAEERCEGAPRGCHTVVCLCAEKRRRISEIVRDET